MKMKRLTFWLLAGLFYFSSTSLRAESYVIGVESLQFKPYSEYSAGVYSGYLRDLMDLFSNASGYQFDFKALPINRLNREVLSGVLDFRLPDNAYWIADKKQGKGFYYSKPLVNFIDGVMVKPERKGKGVNALKTLGMTLGFTPQPYQELIDAGKLKIANQSNSRRLINQVSKGVHGGMYANVAVITQQMENVLADKDKLVFDPGLPYVESSMQLSTMKHPRVIQALDKFLDENQELVDQLKQKYGLQ